MNAKDVMYTVVGLLFVVFLAGCGMKEPTDLTPLSKEDGQKVVDFVTQYKKEMIDAVNKRDVDELEETYFLPNTSFSQAFHRYVEDLSKQAATKSLVSFEVGGVYRDQEAGDLLVDVDEHVVIERPNGELEDVNRSVRYWIVEGSESEYRLYTIIDRSN
ncbi:TcaA NTF2-like domain-containing protein [Shouchella lonarensis]|uniref:TcaA protein NTF2-like domain-containing protein n=1 Tax=Shouchella lonarensis TaxID=1464122 RepID=A0A1G6KTM4_9BACI|nr:hypothetical protein [Shouchella lonarensis]SDC34158.1 hypothetical protein SAMN05421737_107144 [Shouchella lonarensis]